MWQAQLKGSKTWHLLPPPECEDVCSQLSFLVEPGDAGDYICEIFGCYTFKCFLICSSGRYKGLVSWNYYNSWRIQPFCAVRIWINGLPRTYYDSCRDQP
jgi:hypothetical protein